jgi:hypothetical protein
MRKRLLAIVATVVGLAMMVPAIATAQVPPGTIPDGTVPPEVQDAVDGALAEVLATLIANPPPAVDGVGEASASPNHTQASVVEIDGLVTVGKSEATNTGSKVTVLNIGGEDILVRNGDANGGTYSGHAAPAGDAIDQANDALCPGGPPAANSAPKQCVLLLYSDATTGKQTTTQAGSLNIQNMSNSAQFRALSIYSPAGPESLTLGSTSASHNDTRISVGTFPFRHICTDVATSFLISGGGALAALILVNPGGPLNGVAASSRTIPFTQAC